MDIYVDSNISFTQVRNLILMGFELIFLHEWICFLLVVEFFPRSEFAYLSCIFSELIFSHYSNLIHLLTCHAYFPN